MVTMEKCLQTKMPTFNCILFCLQYPLPPLHDESTFVWEIWLSRSVYYARPGHSVFIGMFENAQSITGRWLTVAWLNVGWLSVTKPCSSFPAGGRAWSNCHLLHFKLSKHFLLSENFLSKIPNLGLENYLFWENLEVVKFEDLHLFLSEICSFLS